MLVNILKALDELLEKKQLEIDSLSFDVGYHKNKCKEQEKQLAELNEQIKSLNTELEFLREKGE